MTTQTPVVGSIVFSDISNPNTWKIEGDSKCLVFASPSEAKRAEELFSKMQRELAAAQEALAQERERAERAEGKVEGLLLESEAAHANLTALRDDRRKLQKALAFWMPCIASEDTKAGKRVAEEANLLIGLPVKDNEPCAQELGWIVMESEADLLRHERYSAEARAEAAEKDAERYRWLRDRWTDARDFSSISFFGADRTFPRIDAAIDAAIAEGKKP